MHTVDAADEQGSPSYCTHLYLQTGLPIFVEHWGVHDLQFYPNFALFSTLGGMNLDRNFVQVSILNEDQKKKKVFTKNRTLCFPNSGEDQKKRGPSPKMEHFFFLNSSGHLGTVRSHAQLHTRVKFLRGMRM